MPASGTGVVYSAALEPLLASAPELVDVVEIEPQSLWIEHEGCYIAREDVDAHLAALPGKKLVHSIGAPVGGTWRPTGQQTALLRRTVERLGSPWASEHLSFNGTESFRTGFFLPPRQTAEGVAVAAASIAHLRDALAVPLAFETGVNYLRPAADEMADSEFVHAVAAASGAGILLDLHNVYCNARNGREPAGRFLSGLPHERVWELHLAGGFEAEGYWLDAHSGEIPDAVWGMAREIVPELPHLGAIVFEIYPAYVEAFGLGRVARELERLRELWELRRPGRRPVQRIAARALSTGGASPAEWELSLGGLVIGRDPVDALGEELAADPGVGVLRGLVEEFRASMVVGALRLSSRLLMLALGPDIFRAILQDFWRQTPPRQYAGAEAEAFAEYLVARNVRVPQLQKLLEFERAAMATLRDDQRRVVKFDIDPLPMIRALTEGHLLQDPGTPGEYEIELTGESAS